MKNDTKLEILTTEKLILTSVFAIISQCTRNMRKTSQLVFTARLRPQFRTPPSFDRCMPPRRRFNQNILPSVELLQQCHCRNRHRGKLQNLSPPSALFEWSPIFFTIHRRHRRKKWWTGILKFKICDFCESFEIFKKASRGPSAADLDHYGHGQTRSQ